VIRRLYIAMTYVVFSIITLCRSARLYSRTHTHTAAHTHPLSLCLSVSLSHTHTPHTLYLSLSLSVSLSLSLCLSLSYIHTHIHTYIHTHIHHPHRRLPQRELVLLCPFETTIISPSYTSHHGIHHIIIKDILYV
jgi:hypothetical protein